MSLELAAQHLASRGRKGDSMLVHMAPEEVSGLQALAKAHGGSLTSNPDTGLPEANFLKSILPTLIGAGLSFIPGVGPLMAAGIVGGLQTARTGSLSKGLMAGLGAYGGAGLAGGLKAAAGAGASAALTPPAGGLSGIGGSSMNEAVANAMGGAGGVGSNLANLQTGVGGATAATSGGLGLTPGAATGLKANAQIGLSGSPLGGAIAPVTAMPPTALTPGVNYTLSPQALSPATQAPGMLSTMGQGINALGTETGRTAFLGNAASKGVAASGVGGTSGLLKSGLAAMSPALLATPEMTRPAPDTVAHNFTFNPGRVEDPQMDYDGAYTGERTYFNPTFTRRAADGGMMDSGGTIEDMSNRNQAMTLMASGGQMFAEGGETKAVKPVEQDPYYTMSGQSGDAFKYLMGQMPAPAARPAAQPVAPVQAPVAATPAPAGVSLFGRTAQRLTGGGAANPSSNFSFDPNTGMFTRLPPTTPEPEAASPATFAYGDFAKNGGLMSLAQGGVSHLGDYSDGGRLLKGPGDGVSDSIPATIADKRPARLADGEFVVPARIVSELGNGSTEAGARKLYAMMDRVQKARSKTTGKDRVAANTRAERLLPA